MAEIEYVLFLEKESKDKYLRKVTSALHQLEQYQREFEPLLSLNEEKLTHAAFKEDCDYYFGESKAMPALLKEENPNQKAIVSIAEKSRVFYDKSIQMFDILVESQTKYPISWLELIKKFFIRNRLALVFVYISGMAALLILIFIFYDRVRKRCN